MSEKPAITSADSETVAVWQEIELLVREVAQFSKSGCDKESFYLYLLERLIRAMSALGGAIWVANAKQELVMHTQLRWEKVQLDDHPEAEAQHSKLVESIYFSQQAVMCAADASYHGELPNPTAHLLLFQPVTLDDELFALIEVALPAETSPLAEKGYSDFLSTMGELAVDFHRWNLLTQLQQKMNFGDQCSLFAEQVHASLQLPQTSAIVANEGRRFIQCDRCSVLQRRGRRFEVLAVSGIDRVERRARLIDAMERLTSLIALSGEMFVFQDEQADYPPQLEVPLQNYLEVSRCRTLVVVPLAATLPAEETQINRSEQRRLDDRQQAIAFVLLVEKFDTQHVDEQFYSRIETVERHSQLALNNARTYSRIPFRQLWEEHHPVRWLFNGNRLTKSVILLSMFCLVLCALIFVPVKFEVEASGELQPETLKHIFAGTTGVIDQVHVQHGQLVNRDDLLLELTDSQLDFELTRIRGEQQSLQKKLDSLKVVLQAGIPQNAEDRLKFNSAIAEREELQQQLKSLQAQLQIKQGQEQALKIRSPIAGEVLTWNVLAELQARPVTRGQQLLTVANLNKKWNLEIEIPDRLYGYLAAYLELRKDDPNFHIPVDFIMLSNPEQTHHLELKRSDIFFSQHTETTEEGDAVVRATIALDRAQFSNSDLRPGSEVLTKTACGKRSLGFVWFHELIQLVKSKFWY